MFTLAFVLFFFCYYLTTLEVDEYSPKDFDPPHEEMTIGMSVVEESRNSVGHAEPQKASQKNLKKKAKKSSSKKTSKAKKKKGKGG